MTSNRNRSLLLKIIVCLSLLYISALALSPPAKVYERSMEQTFPDLVGLLFYVLLFSGIVLIAMSITTKDIALAEIGFLSIAVAYLGYFLIPLARGYEFYSGYTSDTYTHLGIVHDILANNHVERMIYPGTHTLIAESFLVSGASPRELNFLFPYLFFIAFIVFISLFARRYGKSRKLALAVLLASVSLLFGKYRLRIMPWMFAYTFLFILLISAKQYSVQKSNSWLVIAFVSSVGVLLYHPFTSLYALLALAMVTLVLKKSDIRYATAGVASVLVITSLALLSYHILGGTVDGFIRGAIISVLQGSQGAAAATASRAGTLDYTILQYLSRFIIPVWGVVIFYVGFGGLTILYLLRKTIRNEASKFEELATILFIGGFFVSGFIFLVEVFSHSIRRAGQSLIIASILATGIGLFYLSKRVYVSFDSNQKAAVAAALVLVIAPVAMYNASTGYADNNHVTESVLDGYEWHLEHKVGSTQTAARSEIRFADYYYGYQDTRLREAQGDRVWSKAGIPDGLGYGENRSISESLNSSDNVYLITKTDDMEWFLVEPEWRRGDLNYYTTKDYQKLQDDNTAHRVYSNGGFDLWVVEGTDDN